MTDYLSDEELGQEPRSKGDIDDVVWRAILAQIRRCASSGSFGNTFPETCPDGNYVVGTDIASFEAALLGEVPHLAEFRDVGTILDSLEMSMETPSVYDILDLVHFCWKTVGKPRKAGSHAFFAHDHLVLDEEAGREEFRDTIETIFRRNGLAYHIETIGKIRRVVPPALGEVAARRDFDTGDGELDRLLTSAQRKFLDPHPNNRQEALEALWDAWERLKTLDGQGDKKAKTKAMLDRATGPTSPTFREALEAEARALTDIGNDLRIRHSETDREVLARSEHADYLFYRMFSLIRLILDTRSRP